MRRPRTCHILVQTRVTFRIVQGGANVALDGFNDGSDPLLKKLMEISDNGFKEIITAIQPTLIIAIGGYAFNRYIN